MEKTWETGGENFFLIVPKRCGKGTAKEVVEGWALPGLNPFLELNYQKSLKFMQCLKSKDFFKKLLKDWTLHLN